MSALDGLRVVDLSRVLAGPICAMILGDHGADVVKVEPPQLDDTRLWGPPFVGADAPGAAPGYAGESAYYLMCNRNKRGIVLDLSKPQGREVALRLCDRADVVIENFRHATLDRWGLGYEDVLRKRNPRLILASISGFGADGPYASLPGYDVVAQAMGGIMSVTGEPGSGPNRVGVAFSDLASGLMAVQGILLAIAARERTGVGQRVDVSLLESTVSMLTHLASNYLVGGVPGRQYGNTHPSIVPYRIFKTADGWLYVCAGNDRQFALLARELGRPELAADPEYRSNPDRVRNRVALEALIGGIIGARATAEWVEKLWKAGVPCGPVLDIAEVFGDPQVLHREMVVETPHPTIAGGVRMTGIPIKLSGTPGAIRRHPPLAGEHTREILGELGYDGPAIAALERSGVVRSSPLLSSTAG